MNALYLDPAAATGLISGIAGVAVALGAFIVVRVRSAKKKMADKLGIDENKNKEVEEDVKIIDSENEEN